MLYETVGPALMSPVILRSQRSGTISFHRTESKIPSQDLRRVSVGLVPEDSRLICHDIYDQVRIPSSSTEIPTLSRSAVGRTIRIPKVHLATPSRVSRDKSKKKIIIRSIEHFITLQTVKYVLAFVQCVAFMPFIRII